MGAGQAIQSSNANYCITSDPITGNALPCCSIRRYADTDIDGHRMTGIWSPVTSNVTIIGEGHRLPQFEGHLDRPHLRALQNADLEIHSDGLRVIATPNSMPAKRSSSSSQPSVCHRCRGKGPLPSEESGPVQQNECQSVEPVNTVIHTHTVYTGGGTVVGEDNGGRRLKYIMKQILKSFA